MRFKVGEEKISEVNFNVTLVYKNDTIHNDEIYEYISENEIFKAEVGEVWTKVSTKGEHHFYLGLGDLDEHLKSDKFRSYGPGSEQGEIYDFNYLRDAFHSLGKEFMKYKVNSTNIDLTPVSKNYGAEQGKQIVQAASEGLYLSRYSFEYYLSKRKTFPSLEYANLYSDNISNADISEGIKETRVLVDGISMARDLVNEPAVVMTPTNLAERAKINLEEVKVEVEILGESEIQDMGMEAFLTVARGSKEEPKLIVMKYMNGEEDDETIALVGKGLTYDSGGYSLKPSTSMDTMHSDMAGAAAVIGAMISLARSGVKKNVIAVVAACENMVSEKSYRPGDIIASMSGKTIEAINTDAEGRLTLADAIYYAKTVLKADKIIDVATLTGACVVALGDVTTGAVTNNQELMSDVLKGASLAGEPVWQLPAFKEYEEMIKGTRADLVNTSSGRPGAGTITAGLFLKQFAGDTPWVHLDIAGTSYLDKQQGHLPKGATGVAVKTLYHLVRGNEKLTNIISGPHMI